MGPPDGHDLFTCLGLLLLIRQAVPVLIQAFQVAGSPLRRLAVCGGIMKMRSPKPIVLVLVEDVENAEERGVITTAFTYSALCRLHGDLILF